MAKPPIRIRRSAVPGAIPTTGQLALGELAVNTFDGKAFLKKDNGTESIVEIGGGGGAYTAPVALALYEKTNSGVADSFDGTETRFQLRDTSGNLVSISNALYLAISVNGVVQKPNTGTPSSPFEGFYVTANATQGYDIVFDTAPATGADFFGVLAGTFTATSGTSGIKILDDISSQFNGTLTAFTLKYNTANYTPDFPDAVVVSVGGVVQVPTDAYSISGSTITFTSAPPTGASFYALSFEIGTNPDFDVINSVSSTSTTDAASANAVKTAYDLANAALPKAGGIITGNLEIGNTGSLTFEGSTANAFETTLAATDPTADRTITLPDVSGTVVTTGDTGSVTSTMIADGTIVNGDINTSAAIAGTKISPDFGSQNVTTTGTSTAASFIPTSSTAPTNGVYLPAANSVAISTNGTGRLFVDASGNLLVGTSSSGSQSGTFGQSLRGNNPGLTFIGTEASGAIRTIYESAGNLIFWNGTGGTEIARFDSSGRLGIGTSSPAGQLDVSDGTVANTQSPKVYLCAENGADRVACEIRQGRYNKDVLVVSSNQSLSANLFNAIENGTSRFVITGAGRVGIGTSPSQLLHIKGSGDAKLLINSSNNASDRGIYFATSTDSEVLGYIKQEYTTGNLDISSGTGSYGSVIAFRTAGTERARVDQNGRLLVGTSTNLTSDPVQISLSQADSLGGLSITNQQWYGYGARILFQSKNNSAGDIKTLGAIVGEGDGQNKGRLVFSTTADGASSPAERLRITNAGNIDINGAASPGWTTSSGGLRIAPDTTYGVALSNSRPAIFGVQNFLSNYHNGAYIGGINTSTNATNFATTSDYRLKENVGPVNGALQRALALRPCEFNFINEPSQRVTGFLAHEVQEVVPNAVDGEKDAVNPDGTIKTQCVDYSKLVPLLTAALQEAVAKIESLEARLTAAGI